MDEKLMTPEQVADRLQVQSSTVLTWLQKGKLRGIKLGRLWRIRSSDLEAFINGGSPPADKGDS